MAGQVIETAHKSMISQDELFLQLHVEQLPVGPALHLVIQSQARKDAAEIKQGPVKGMVVRGQVSEISQKDGRGIEAVGITHFVLPGVKELPEVWRILET